MRQRWVPFATLLVVLATFLPTIGFEFVNWDDALHVLDNPVVQSPANASRSAAFLTPGLGYPAPLPVATYRIEHALVGNEPALYHATNILVHLLSCALLFALCRRLSLSNSAAAIATLFFGIHPAVAESVSWVSGRKDLMVTAISLATLLACLVEERPTLRTRAAALFGFILALACKPVAVVLLPTIAAFRILVLRRSFLESLGIIAPLLAPLAIYVPLAFSGQSALGAVQEPLRVLAQARSIWFALGIHAQLVFFAREPSAKHMPPSLTPAFDASVDLAPLILIALFAVVAYTLPRERRRIVLAALVFCVCAYAPNSNLIPLARYAADTYVYLPLVGIGLCLGLGFDRALGALGERARFYAIFAPITLSCFLVLLTIPASARYHDSYALWAQARRANPGHPRICRNWANASLKYRGPEFALRAVESCSRHFGMASLHKVRGRALLELGDVHEALKELELALEERPQDAPLRSLVEQIHAAGISSETPSPSVPEPRDLAEAPAE